jgi:hypothetical protein
VRGPVGCAVQKGIARKCVDVVIQSVLESFSIATRWRVFLVDEDPVTKIELSINTKTRRNSSEFVRCTLMQK